MSFSSVLPSSEDLQTAKRPQDKLLEVENDWSKTESVTEIMLCKSDALIQLQRQLEAYECYEQ